MPQRRSRLTCPPSQRLQTRMARRSNAVTPMKTDLGESHEVRVTTRLQRALPTPSMSLERPQAILKLPPRDPKQPRATPGNPKSPHAALSPDGHDKRQRSADGHLGRTAKGAHDHQAVVIGETTAALLLPLSLIVSTYIS